MTRQTVEGSRRKWRAISACDMPFCASPAKMAEKSGTAMPFSPASMAAQDTCKAVVRQLDAAHALAFVVEQVELTGLLAGISEDGAVWHRADFAVGGHQRHGGRLHPSPEGDDAQRRGHGRLLSG